MKKKIRYQIFKFIAVSIIICFILTSCANNKDTEANTNDDTLNTTEQDDYIKNNNNDTLSVSELIDYIDEIKIEPITIDTVPGIKNM